MTESSATTETNVPATPQSKRDWRRFVRPGEVTREGLPFDILFALTSIAAVIPLLAVPHPPLEDLPQHLAAIRVLRSYSDPDFGLTQFFAVDLLRTQYLAYYLVAVALSCVMPITTANIVLVCASVIGTPYALRGLLRSLDGDERLAILVLPLTYNAHLILGFFNFLAAIPLALAGLALAARLRASWSTKHAIALGTLTLVCFYTHVVPFAFLGLGATLLAVGENVRATTRRLAPLVPGGLAAVIWTKLSPAGRATATAALGAEAGPVAVFAEWRAAFNEIPMWLTDVFQGDADDKALVVWGVLALTAFAIGANGSATASPVRARIAVLAPIAALAYFLAPSAYDWIWPISARFPLLACIFAVVAMPRLSRVTGTTVVVVAVLLSAFTFRRAYEAFAAFERDEVADFADAVEAIPPRQRVAGLIYDRHSANIAFAPFLHFVAYYQAEKGGAVMFTFADFPQSPFQFREENRPPRVQPRWEWTPELVQPSRDLGWYDYVLTRGGPGAILNDPAFSVVYRGPRWSVFRRHP